MRLRRITWSLCFLRFPAVCHTQSSLPYGVPEGSDLMIKSLAGDDGPVIKSLTLLGSNAPVAWKRIDAGLQVRLPLQKPCEHAFVLKIEQGI